MIKPVIIIVIMYESDRPNPQSLGVVMFGFSSRIAWKNLKPSRMTNKIANIKMNMSIFVTIGIFFTII